MFRRYCRSPKCLSPKRPDSVLDRTAGKLAAPANNTMCILDDSVEGEKHVILLYRKEIIINFSRVGEKFLLFFFFYTHYGICTAAVVKNTFKTKVFRWRRRLKNVPRRIKNDRKTGKTDGNTALRGTFLRRTSNLRS